MEDEVDALHRLGDTAAISNITNVETQLGVEVGRPDLVLLFLVSAEDPNLTDIGMKKPTENRVTKGSGSARNQQSFVFEHAVSLDNLGETLTLAFRARRPLKALPC